MQAKGTTDYKSGFTFAFEQLLNVSLDETSSFFVSPLQQLARLSGLAQLRPVGAAQPVCLAVHSNELASANCDIAVLTAGGPGLHKTLPEFCHRPRRAGCRPGRGCVLPAQVPPERRGPAAYILRERRPNGR